MHRGDLGLVFWLPGKQGTRNRSIFCAVGASQLPPRSRGFYRALLGNRQEWGISPCSSRFPWKWGCARNEPPSRLLVSEIKNQAPCLVFLSAKEKEPAAAIAARSLKYHPAPVIAARATKCYLASHPPSPVHRTKHQAQYSRLAHNAAPQAKAKTLRDLSLA